MLETFSAQRSSTTVRPVPSPRSSTTVVDLDGPRPAAPPARAGTAWSRRYVAALVLVDSAAAALAALAALTFGAEHVGSSFQYYDAITIAFPILWLVGMTTGRTYEWRFLTAGSEEYRRVFDAGVRVLAAVATIAFGLQLDLARDYVVVALPTAIALSLFGRYGARQVLHRLRARGQCLAKVVLIGDEASAVELIRHMRRAPYAGFQVVGACLAGSSTGLLAAEGVPVLGSSTAVTTVLRVTGADTVAVAARSDVTGASLRRLCWDLEGSGVDVLVAPSLTDIAGPRIHIRPVAGLPLLHVEEPCFTGMRRVVKSGLDRLTALAALVLLAPVFIAIGCLVRATSAGPAFFRQVRVGRHGEQFTILKFRSMRVSAEEELQALAEQNERADGLLFKMRKDPRITPVGGWLRRFSLDELPQLINVLRGDMSLVGPRPPLPSEVARYQDDVRRRLLVKPGLTGLWQISGRSDLTWDEAVRLDLYYVENWSLALDLMIMWKTAFAVIRSRGAY